MSEDNKFAYLQRQYDEAARQLAELRTKNIELEQQVSNLSAMRSDMQKALEAALSQLETAREALKLYANIEHWDNYESEHILSPGSYEESYPWLPAQTALEKLNPQIANAAKGEVEKEWNRKV